MSQQPPYKHQAWPSWRYGPNGEAQVFHRIEDVPVGWKDDPHAFADKAEDAADESEERAEDEHGGYSKAELEQVLRKGGERVYSRDSAYKMYVRAEKAGLIENGQLAGAALDDAE